jgi:hypothetical protein
MIDIGINSILNKRQEKDVNAFLNRYISIIKSKEINIADIYIESLDWTDDEIVSMSFRVLNKKGLFKLANFSGIEIEFRDIL